MRKVFYLATLLVLLLPSAVLAEYGDPSGIVLYPWDDNLKTELLCGHTYTSDDFDIIKSGSMSVSEDGTSIEFKNLYMNCEVPEEDYYGATLFRFTKQLFTINLTGENRLLTNGPATMVFNGRQITITGGGSLTTSAIWYDFLIESGDLTLDNATMNCQGPWAVRHWLNNSTPSSITVRNSRFEGNGISYFSHLTMEGCQIKVPSGGYFDAEETEGSQIKNYRGETVGHFVITTPDDNSDLELVKNGDFEGSDFSSFLYRKNAGVVQNATASDIIVEDGNRCLKIVSQANAKNIWDSQLFIRIPENIKLHSGTTVCFSMRVKASRPTTIKRSYYDPQVGWDDAYCEDMFGDISVSTEWKSYTGYYTGSYLFFWTESFLGKENTVILDLNCDQEHPIEFYFDDISITLVNADEINASGITFEKQTLIKNHTYTHEDFEEIKSGSFYVSEDGRELTFNHLNVESNNFMFSATAPLKLVLIGDNRLTTGKNVIMDAANCPNLTITGDGSLTTHANPPSGGFDFQIDGCTVVIDHTTLNCKSWCTFMGDSKPEGKVIVNHSSVKGRSFLHVASLTLINSAFVSPEDAVFDPKDEWVPQVYTPTGEPVYEYEIGPAEGDFSNRVSPWKYDDIIIPLGGTKEVTFSMKNDGTEDIREIECVLSVDGIETQKMTIPFDEPYTKTGDDFAVTLPVAAMEKAGKRELTLTVTKVNGKENSSPQKAVAGFLHTVSEDATRRVVVEEFTGTWCGWCTRGIVALDMLNREYGDRVITIAVHSDDPMVADSYTLGSNSFPSARVNRGDVLDPYYGSSDEQFGIRDVVEREISIMPATAISVSATWADEAQSAIQVKTETTFLIETDASQYGIGYALLEDGMKGTGRSWAQQNYYAGSSTGDPNLDTLAALPAAITDIEYDHVAVDAWEINNGANGCFTTAQTDVPQENTYLCDISANTLIQDKARLSVVVLLIDKQTGIIVNAAKTAIGDYDPSAIRDILTERSRQSAIYHINGRKVGSTADNHAKNLPKGIYVIDGRKVVVK